MRCDFVVWLSLLSIAWNVSAAEIFLCKTAQGGEFWSSGACSNSGGYMVDIVQVPGNMPFKEQASFADQLRNKKAVANAQVANTSAQQHKCAAIDAELRQIFSKYESGKYVPAEQVGPDQIRTSELKVSRSQLLCQSR